MSPRDYSYSAVMARKNEIMKTSMGMDYQDFIQSPIAFDYERMLRETGWEKLLPVCDGVMLDLKAWDSACHLQLTGRDNAAIKRSILFLAERGKLAELRLLVIPGHVDYLQHVDALAAFIHRLGNILVRLNAFHAHGVYGEAKAWPSATPEDVEELAKELRAREVDNLIFPALYL